MLYPAVAGAVLDSLTEKMGVRDRLETYRVWSVWDEVVGPQTAQHAQPFRLRGGVLEVRVDHPVWMQQLQLLKPRILERLNHAITPGVLSDIILRHGKPEIIPPIIREPDIPTAPLSPEEESRINKILPPDNDDLHHAWRTLLTQHFQARTRSRS